MRTVLGEEGRHAHRNSNGENDIEETGAGRAWHGAC